MTGDSLWLQISILMFLGGFIAGESHRRWVRNTWARHLERQEFLAWKKATAKGDDRG